VDDPKTRHTHLKGKQCSHRNQRVKVLQIILGQKKPVSLINAEWLCGRATLLTRPRSSAGFFASVINDVLTFLTILTFDSGPGHHLVISKLCLSWRHRLNGLAEVGDNGSEAGEATALECPLTRHASRDESLEGVPRSQRADREHSASRD